MALRDRLAALQLIDRIKQHEMEAIGAELSSLRAAQKTLEDQSTQLRADALREANDSTETTRIFLPSYLKSVDARQRGLSKERETLQEQARGIEEKLFTSFRESKTTDQVLDRVAREIALEESRALTSEMDDATRSLYLLQRAAKTSG